MASKEEVKKLIDERDELDKQLANYFVILKANNVDMETPLVDAEGYPRADIDVYAVREARNKIICLRNDRKALMGKIEEGLYKVHETVRKEEGASSSKEDQMEMDDDVDVTGHRTSNDPIATVQSVVAGSPSADAGLKNDDVIIQFGSLHAGNFKKLDQIGEIVRNSVGKRVRVTVLRDGHAVRLALKPNQWTGQGLLGCTIVPVKS